LQPIWKDRILLPDRPAISEERVESSYRQLNEKANQVATGLSSLGVKAGDYIGLFAPNSTDWIAFYFGVIKTGATAVTLSSLLMGTSSAF